MTLAGALRSAHARLGEALTKLGDQALVLLAVAPGGIVACVGLGPQDAHAKMLEPISGGAAAS